MTVQAMAETRPSTDSPSERPLRNPPASRLRGSQSAKANRVRREVVGHPATADVFYTEAETEFMLAVHDYKARTGNRFPTTRELLYVVFSLGYRKD